jgi:hypothetical protein
MPLGNFMKLSSLFDESNYHEHTITQQNTKTTPTIVMKTTTRAEPKKPNHQVCNSSQQKQKNTEKPKTAKITDTREQI